MVNKVVEELMLDRTYAALADPTRRALLVALRDGVDLAEAAPGSLHAHCTSELARFKAPKEFIVVEEVRRLGNGKADYRWAKSVATQKAMA